MRSDFTGADLFTAKLPGFTAGRSTFAGANFYLTDLTGATFRGSDLNRAYFVEDELNGATITGATFAGVRSLSLLDNPAIMPARYSVINGLIVGPRVDLSGTYYLTDTDLRGVSLAGADLAGANLGGVDERRKSARRGARWRRLGTDDMSRRNPQRLGRAHVRT